MVKMVNSMLQIFYCNKKHNSLQDTVYIIDIYVYINTNSYVYVWLLYTHI